jgi:hypothetical protein
MTNVIDFLVDVHGLVRWFILSLAVVGAARSLVSMLTVSAKFTRLDVGLSNAYSGILDLQGLIGILMMAAALVTHSAVRWLHPIIMILAIMVGHLNRRFRARPDRTRHQYQAAIYAGSLVLVAIGLALINQLYLP